MRGLSLLLLVLAGTAQEAALSIAPHEKDRRWVLAEGPCAPGPCEVLDAKGNPVPSQCADGKVRWIVPFIPAREKATFTLRAGASKLPALVLAEGPGGSISVKDASREITRYYASAGTANKKPCFYPLVGHGVNVLRGYPLEDRPGEAKDHPHQTGIYHAFGDVNGKDYWSKVPIAHRKLLRKEAGPACVRIAAENAWGEDLVEVAEVAILNAGADVIMDWRITITAANGPVVLGKDQRMAKEGSFAVRVGAELSKKGDAPDMMFDSLGNKGEKAVRANAAPWIDYVGDFGGKKVGVAVMNHPSSFRYPGTWHARAYGLFAANPWYTAEAKSLGRVGEHTLPRGESVTFGYRIYVHAGDASEGKVADVFEGYAHSKVSDP
jgi:hypothetical protein